MYYGEAAVGDHRRALTQEQRIMRIFEVLEGRNFTAFELQQRMGRIPITSVRRALTDLTDAGKVRMTGRKRKGQYHKSTHTWELVK